MFFLVAALGFRGVHVVIALDVRGVWKIAPDAGDLLQLRVPGRKSLRCNRGLMQVTSYSCVFLIENRFVVTEA